LFFCSIKYFYDISFSIGARDRTYRRRHMKKSPSQRPKSKSNNAMKQRALQKLHNHKKPKHRTKRAWCQHPARYIYSFMCLVILTIPAVIVAPSSGSNSKAESASEHKQVEQKQTAKKKEKEDDTRQVSDERQAARQVENVSLEDYVKGVV